MFALACQHDYGNGAFFGIQECPVGDLFREIEEELRQERFEKLWRSYGRYVIGAAVAVVVAVGGELKAGRLLESR